MFVREKLEEIRCTLDLAKLELEDLENCVDIDDYRVDLQADLIKAIEAVQDMF